MNFNRILYNLYSGRKRPQKTKELESLLVVMLIYGFNCLLTDLLEKEREACKFKVFWKTEELSE